MFWLQAQAFDALKRWLPTPAVDTLRNLLGNCAAALEHRGPVTIDFSPENNNDTRPALTVNNNSTDETNNVAIDVEGDTDIDGDTTITGDLTVGGDTNISVFNVTNVINVNNTNNTFNNNTIFTIIINGITYNVGLRPINYVCGVECVMGAIVVKFRSALVLRAGVSECDVPTDPDEDTDGDDDFDHPTDPKLTGADEGV